MTLRQKLACVGLTVFGLQIASAAAGGAPLADRLRLWLDPEQLLAASVRMELGAPPVDASPTPEAAAALSDAFDIEIGAKDLVPENFNSAKRLLAMVQRLQDED